MLGKEALVSMAVLGLIGAPSVSADTHSFKVQFAGCSEFVGWGPVSLAAAQPLVPVDAVPSDFIRDRKHLLVYEQRLVAR